MSALHVERSAEIARTPRVMQVEGLFDVPPSERDHREWDFELPVDERAWQIGLIVGPSGSGKTTLLRERFGEPVRHRWSRGAVVDDFAPSLTIQEITAALSSVGFSSPPSWLRPYSTLSNGEQFRASLARALVEDRELVVIDEFTSVVDRTVARIGSAAVAKHVRRSDRRLVVASCHYDIVDWLQPDWVYDVGAMLFSWRHLRRRPDIVVGVVRASRDAWRVFGRHHYLSADLPRGADCHVALVEGEPAAFVATVPFPHARVPRARRGSRMVTLPDFQGVGIGNVVFELVASVWRARGYRFYTTASHPAAVRHWARSPRWHMNRAPGFIAARGRTSGLRWRQATQRLTASFEYVGDAAPRDVAETL